LPCSKSNGKTESRTEIAILKKKNEKEDNIQWKNGPHRKCLQLPGAILMPGHVYTSVSAASGSIMAGNGERNNKKKIKEIKG